MGAACVLHTLSVAVIVAILVCLLLGHLLFPPHASESFSPLGQVVLPTRSTVPYDGAPAENIYGSYPWGAYVQPLQTPCAPDVAAAARAISLV